jgi:hypothetical protein
MKHEKTTSSGEFAAIFARLRAILQKYSDRLTVTADTSTRYCLAGGSHPTHKKPMDIAWVEIRKAYVSFHHMGVYACPRLRESMAPELKARMQGKSCFNFAKLDEALFKQLEQVTSDGFAAFRTAGYIT